ncbi:hypothetical protein Syun_017002 [Stephania yunnanensis]|uniref:Uncharacterized protein n=1 Tax=Stephania yunnanensis TaxID=152371 RepID=A0AAP0J7P5_9MAGN
MDSLANMCTLKSVKKIVSDVTNYLLGRSLGATTTTTTTNTTATRTTTPTMAALKHSLHDSTSTQSISTLADALRPPIDARPQRVCLTMNILEKI